MSLPGFAKPKRKPLESPPIIFLTGRSGVGKSSAAALGFSHYRYLQTRPTNYDSAADYLRRLESEGVDDHGLRLPEAVTNLERRRGEVDWFETWGDFLDMIDAGKLKEPGVIVDEGSTLLGWAFDDFKANNKWTFDSVADVKGLMEDTIETFRAKEKGLIWIGHWQDRVYHPRPGKQGGSSDPRSGALKYPGGIQMPIGTMIEGFSKHVDAVWKLALFRPDAEEEGEIDPNDAANAKRAQRYIITESGNDEEIIKTARDAPRLIPCESPRDFVKALEDLHFRTGRKRD